MWFSLFYIYNYFTMHGAKNINVTTVSFSLFGKYILTAEIAMLSRHTYYKE